MSRDLERAALSLAVADYRVFPIAPQSKRPPLIKAPAKRATTDPLRVADWWREWPDANPGVATGAGLLVVDCDSEEAVRRVLDLGVPENTPTVGTPRGRHIYLHGDAHDAVGIIEGVDIRAGNYVVGAGAVRPDGVYEWLVPPTVEEAPVPPALRELLVKRAVREREQAEVRELVRPGGRNNYLCRVGGGMKRTGFSAEAIRAALLTENRIKCDPPLPEDEVERIARSVASMKGPPPWVDPWSLTRDQDLSTNERLVLHALCRRAKDDGTVRGGKWLQEWTRVSERSMSRVIRELQEKGKLTVLVRANRQRGTANVYKLAMGPMPPALVLGSQIGG